jgi:predicted component of type VI protein secretion system
MKMMTCRQLGGACELEFRASSFEEIAELSKQHGMEMFQQGDPPHLEAMEGMKALMGDPDAMEEWFEGKRQEFEALPDGE